MYSIYRSVIIRVGIVAVCLLLPGFSYAQNAAIRLMITADGGEVELMVRNISDNELATDGLITWDDVVAGATGWKLANQYIEISHTDLPVSWGMQIYTDNESGLADPRYTGTANPAGLIKVDNTLMALPMAWRITDHLLTGADLTDPVERSDRKGFNDYLWHFLKDKNTPDDPATTDVDESFVNTEEYVTIWNQAGIAWNEGGRSGNPKKAYIYMAAKFTMASINSEYKTSALTLELFDEFSPLFPIYLYKDAPLTEFPDEPGATLENHFAPSGWMNHGPGREIITVDPRCEEVTPHSGEHCFKIQWNGNPGTDGYRWGGVVWLEPEDIWALGGESPTHNGYDLRGADYLSFWARTDVDNQNMQIQTYFGNEWDSCGQTTPLWRSPVLTTEWQEYIIPVLGRDMSDVTGGLGVVFNDEHDPFPNGCIIYLDDIKFDRF